MCQIDEDNLHEWSPVECVGFGEAISNVTPTGLGSRINM